MKLNQNGLLACFARLQWLALALLVLSVIVSMPSLAQTSQRTCGNAPLPACSGGQPIPTEWAVIAVDQAGIAQGTYDSLDEAKSAYEQGGTTWACYLDFDGQAELPNSVDFGGPNPGATDGIVTRDVYRQDYHAQAKIGQGCAGNVLYLSLYLLELRKLYCPDGSPIVYQAGPPVIGPYCPDPPKPESCPSGSTIAGNPCDVSNGNKSQLEVDYQGSGNNDLQFVRAYNSVDAYQDHKVEFYTQSAHLRVREPIGAGWSATYFQHLTQQAINDSTGTHNVVLAWRPDGRMLQFVLYNGVWNPDPDIADILTTTPTGFTYRTQEDTVETYDQNGQLTSVAARGHPPVRVAYTGYPTTLPSTVTDAYGRTLTFQYTRDANGHFVLASITDPAGQSITYTHQLRNNTQANLEALMSVTYQDGTSRLYDYGASGTVLALHLMQITDEAGVAYANWTYDSTGEHVLSSQHAGGVDRYQFTYSGAQRTIVDPLGTTRTLNMQMLWGASRTVSTSATCPDCGYDAARVFDASANIQSRTDFNGNQTTYAYDTDRDLETSRTEAYGTANARTIMTTWDATWRLPSLVTEPNRTTGYTYDSMENILTKTVTDTTVSPHVSRTWTYTYDADGRVLTADGPRTDVADTTTYTYYTCTTGVECGQVHTITDAAGHVTTYNTYNGSGQPLTISDPNGTVTTLTYDARQRILSQTVGSETTGFTYWPTGLLKRVTQPDGSYVQYSYDDAHRLTQISDGAGNKIAYTLDAMGNRTAENAYDSGNTLHQTHSRVINSLNQIYQDINAAGTAAVTTTYAYDSNGNHTGIAAPLSRSTGNQYDELNRLKQITDAGAGVTQFGYDANDNLTSVTDPRTLTTSYTYSGLGDLKTLISPDTGTTTNTVDSAGNLATSTNARGAVTTYSYDALNRPASVAYALGGVTDQTITFSYDAGTYGKGHLTGAADANHSLTWVYDAFARVSSKTQVVGTSALTVGYSYTNEDLTTLTTPSGKAITYTYNSNHQVTAIAVNGIALLGNVTYEPFGAVSGWTWGNGTAAVRTYDGDGNVSTVSSAGAKTYTYDDASRITGITDGGNSALSWGYGYDSLDRLNSAATTTQSQSFAYDANGNRLTQGGDVTSTFTVDAASNRLTGVSGGLTRSYAYDSAGNTTGYGGNTFTYNAAGRMVLASNSAGTTAYVYNALGQRIRKSSAASATIFAYDEAGHLLGEYDQSGNLIQELVWLGDTPVATIRLETCGVSIFYIHTDHLNAPRRISRRSTAQLVWSWESDPFGTAAPNQNPSGLGQFAFNLRFPGEYYDAETGLTQNDVRDYDSATGRFVESDPSGLDGGSSTYGYANASPIQFYDQDGMQAAEPADAYEREREEAEGSWQYALRPPSRPLSLAPIYTYNTGGDNACGFCFNVFYIAQIRPSSRGWDRTQANRQLYDYLASANGPINWRYITRGMQGPNGGLRNPTGFQWHHPVGRPNQLWLVSQCQHEGDIWQSLIHPEGSGGFAQRMMSPVPKP
ncbi:MAG TPA: RHS repeat-associated core domain-containing protein [Steroidobacteraceae bacterium]|jgi:RHS repeat-associated protein